MKRMTGGLLVLAVALTTASADLMAQQGRRGPQMRGQQGRMGMQGQMRGRAGGAQAVEGIMRLHEQLELSEAQLDDLDAVRIASVQQRTAAMVEMTELQSQLSAGLIQPSDVMAAREQWAEANRGQAEQQREQLESILTEAQRESLTQLRREGRAFAAGRAGGGRGGAMRGNRSRGQGRGGFRGALGGQRGPRAFRGRSRIGRGGR